MRASDQTSRRFVATIVVVALLSMQFAVAVYRCPYLFGSPSQSAMSSDCAIGAGTVGQPSLCQAHSDTQSQLKGDIVLPGAPAVVLVSLLILFLATLDAAAARASSYAVLRLARNGYPPLFVRYRVFRK